MYLSVLEVGPIQFLLWTHLLFEYASAGALHARAGVATGSYDISSQSGVRSLSEPTQSIPAETVSSDGRSNFLTSYASSGSTRPVSTEAVSSQGTMGASTTESPRSISYSDLASSLSQATEATSLYLASSSKDVLETSGLSGPLQTRTADASSSRPDTTSALSSSPTKSISGDRSTTRSSETASAESGAESSPLFSSEILSSMIPQSSGHINTQTSTQPTTGSSTETDTSAQSTEESQTSSPIGTTSGQESSTEAGASAQSTAESQTSSPIGTTSGQESSTEAGASAQSTEESQTSSPIGTTSGQESSTEAGASAQSTAESQTSSPIGTTSGQESSTEAGASAQSTAESQTSSPTRTTSGQESSTEAGTSAQSTEESQTSSPTRTTSGQESSTKAGTSTQLTEEILTFSPTRTTSGQESSTEAGASTQSTEESQTSSPTRTTSGQESSTEAGASAQLTEEILTFSPTRTTSGQESSTEASASAQSTAESQTSSPTRTTSGQESSTEAGASAQSTEDSQTSSPIGITSGQESSTEAGASAQSTEESQTSSPIGITSGQESSTEAGASAQSTEESQTSSPIGITSGQESSTEAGTSAQSTEESQTSSPTRTTSGQESSTKAGTSTQLTEEILTFSPTRTTSGQESSTEASASAQSTAESQTSSPTRTTSGQESSTKAGTSSQSALGTSVHSTAGSPLGGANSYSQSSYSVPRSSDESYPLSQYNPSSTSIFTSEPYGTAATTLSDGEPETMTSSFISARPTSTVPSPSITTFISSTTIGSPLPSGTFNSASTSQVVTRSPEGSSIPETSSSSTMSSTSQPSRLSFRTEDMTTMLGFSSGTSEHLSSSRTAGVPTDSGPSSNPGASTSSPNDQTSINSQPVTATSPQPSYTSLSPTYESRSAQTMTSGALTSVPGEVLPSSLSASSAPLTETPVPGRTDFSQVTSLYSSVMHSNENPGRSGNLVTSSAAPEVGTTSSLSFITSAYSEISVSSSGPAAISATPSRVPGSIFSSQTPSPSEPVVLMTSQSSQKSQMTAQPSAGVSASQVFLTSSLSQMSSAMSADSLQITTRLSASNTASNTASHSPSETSELRGTTSRVTATTGSVSEASSSSLSHVGIESGSTLVIQPMSSSQTERTFTTSSAATSSIPQASGEVSKLSSILISSSRYKPTGSTSDATRASGTTAFFSSSRSYTIAASTVSAQSTISTGSIGTSENLISTVSSPSSSFEASVKLTSISHGSSQSLTRLHSSKTLVPGSSTPTGALRSSYVESSASTFVGYTTPSSTSPGLQTTSSGSRLPEAESTSTKTQASRFSQNSQHPESLTTAFQPISSQSESFGSVQPSRTPSLTTVLAPSSTNSEGSTSMDWLPSNIVTASYTGSAHTQSSFDADATATLPQAIMPPTPVTMPPNYSQITIGFKESLNYPFLIENPLASAQIFGFLPEILRNPFSVRASRSNSSTSSVKRDLVGDSGNLLLDNSTLILDKLNWKTSIMNSLSSNVSVSRNGSHNAFRANFSGVAVSSIVPLIVSGNDYITSVAVVYFPTEAVEVLQKMIINGASRIYKNPDQSLRDMALLIDSKIPITGIISSDGSGQGSGSSGGSGSSSGSDGTGSSGSSSESDYEDVKNDNSGTLDGYKNFQVKFFTTKRLVIFLPVFIVAVIMWISLGLLFFGSLFRKGSLQGMAGNLEKKWNTDQKTLDNYFGITEFVGKRQSADLEKNLAGSFHNDESSSDAFDDDDLLAVGNGMFFSKSTGLTYHVDREGNFFYAGTANKAVLPLKSKSTSKLEASNMVPNGESDPKNEANEANEAKEEGEENEERKENEEKPCSNGEFRDDAEVEEFDVDEDGNVELSVSDLERLSLDEHNSDTIESYNNQQYYKMKQLLQNLNNDDIEGAFSTENEGAAGNISSTGNESKLMPLSSESSKLLVQLSTDDDNLEEYFYSEEAQLEGIGKTTSPQPEPESEDNDDVEDFNIDSDSEEGGEDVNDVHVGEFDELDEVMYRRFSSASGLTRFQGGSSSSNTFISLMQQRNSNMLPFSTHALGSTSSEGYHGITASDGLQTDSSNFASQSSPEDPVELLGSKPPMSASHTKSAPKRPNRPSSIISLEKDSIIGQAHSKAALNTVRRPKIQPHQKPSNPRETAGPSSRHETIAVERTQNIKISKKEKSRRSSFRKSVAETLHSANVFSGSTRGRSSTLNDVGPRGHTREELNKIRISGPIYSENSLG